jgi:hypothetical protein
MGQFRALLSPYPVKRASEREREERIPINRQISTQANSQKVREGALDVIVSETIAECRIGAK